MDKSRRLGRGLEALLGPTTVEEAKNDGSLLKIKLANVRPNPYQPRHTFDEQALNDLKGSLKQSGLLQPVVVRETENGQYELIAGERRCRAAQMLGWTEIDAIVKAVDNKTLLTLALVENLQRDALSPIDEALGYQRMLEEFDVSQAELGELVSRDRSTVANALRLLKLPESVQRMLHKGELSTGHARALLQVADQRAVPLIAERVVTENLSVRETEALVRDKRPSKSRPRTKKGEAAPDPQVRRVEDALRDRLSTDVFVAMRGKQSGKVTINFYSNDDLARVLEIVLGEPFNG
ncbi:MAG: ParB/RepB/Spo0J family partition protein [Gemmatimonadota bacterium]|nr:ParB/RepB/Spo0J family partition protein [Gemmatimonadota bacterium]MDH5804315.1 ParB/RepB/Spo0J family partition protein [Gemmatimonadota bacterium]